MKYTSKTNKIFILHTYSNSMVDPIKESFQKVKQDIEFLNQELTKTRNQMIEMCEVLTKLHERVEKQASTQQELNQAFSTHSSTHNPPFKPLNTQILPISTGNEGVSTDRQTNRQTGIFPENPPENAIEDASRILESLDNIKKEVRLKFKKLTDQEFTIFSIIYQLDEQQQVVDYKTLAKLLKLTESSIRDHVSRIIKKGIPVEKKRVNNKNIQLFISDNLKKIATLPTIMQLRDI